MKGRVFILAVMAVGLAVGLFMTGPAAALPPVSWQPEPFDIAVPLGGRLPTKVTATIGEDIPTTRVEVTPSLAPYVASIEPATLPALSAGSEVTIDLVFEVAADTPLNTIDGTLKLRNTNNTSTQAKPLPIILSIAEGQLVSNPSGGYVVIVPTSWTAVAGFRNPTSLDLVPPGKAVNPASEYVGDILIDTIPNPASLPLADFYRQPDQLNLFEIAGAYSVIAHTFGEAVQFSDVPGMLPSSVVAVRLGDRIIEVTDFANRHRSDGIMDSIV